MLSSLERRNWTVNFLLAAAVGRLPLPYSVETTRAARRPPAPKLA
jgi:hypothetical protein